MELVTWESPFLRRPLALATPFRQRPLAPLVLCIGLLIL